MVVCKHVLYIGDFLPHVAFFMYFYHCSMSCMKQGRGNCMTHNMGIMVFASVPLNSLRVFCKQQYQ